jgi:predicted lipid-binding transport protein (Tim44 family)
LLYKLFTRKKAGVASQPAYQRNSHNGHDDVVADYDQPQQTGSTGFNTDVLFNKNKSAPTDQYTQQEAIVVPAGFDQQAFLAGAKIAFATLQKAWDDKDLADIRGLCTDKVFAEIQDQIKASTEENHTDILKLEAELLEVREVGSDLEAAVMFDCMMREDTNARAEQVREVWHFIKPKNSIQPKWFLDGIQQLED